MGNAIYDQGLGSIFSRLSGIALEVLLVTTWDSGLRILRGSSLWPFKIACVAGAMTAVEYLITKTMLNSRSKLSRKPETRLETAMRAVVPVDFAESEILYSLSNISLSSEISRLS